MSFKEIVYWRTDGRTHDGRRTKCDHKSSPCHYVTLYYYYFLNTLLFFIHEALCLLLRLHVIRSSPSSPAHRSSVTWQLGTNCLFFFWFPVYLYRSFPIYIHIFPLPPVFGIRKLQLKIRNHFLYVIYGNWYRVSLFVSVSFFDESQLPSKPSWVLRST